MNQPRLLSLFCGTVSDAGWKAAGFHVTGVDHKAQPRHSCDVFILADALDYCAAHGHEFSAVIASPPCQHYSQITPDKSIHPDLIPITRELLQATGKPYVIENVGGARNVLHSPVMLCGMQFGLKVYRHRFFESNVLLLGMAHWPHRDNTPSAGHGLSEKQFLSITSGGHGIATIGQFTSPKGFISVYGKQIPIPEYARFAFGVDRYVTNYELSQAYPPAYAEYLGRQLIRYVQPETMEAQTHD